MARRRYPRNNGEAFGPRTPQPSAAPQPQLSKPVQIDQSKFDMNDMALIFELPAIFKAVEADDRAVIVSAMPRLISMLERVVVGGLAGRPASEFWQTVVEVSNQISALSNPKN